MLSRIYPIALISLCFAVPACTGDDAEGNDTGSDTGSDTGADVEADGISAPVFEARSVEVGILIVNEDGDTVFDPVGSEVCVFEYPDEDTCGVVGVAGGDALAEIQAPVGERFRIVIRGEGLTPSLTQVNAEHSADAPLLALATPESAVDTTYSRAEVSYSDELGTSIFLMLPDTVDARAFHGATATVVSGGSATVVYSDEESNFDPAATETDGFGTIGLFGASPGEIGVRVDHPLSACTAAHRGAWDRADESGQFDVLIEPDMVTISIVGCGDFAAQDDMECGVTSDDCPDSAAKCRVHFFEAVDGGSATGTTCVAPGDRELDETCERPTGESGADDCEAGLYCANFDLSPGEPRVCRELCLENAECDNGFTCHGMGGGAGRAPGLCLPTCSPFEPRCAEGLTCVPFRTATSEQIQDYGFCWFSGDLEPGASCALDQDGCADGTACVPWSDGARYCSAACDDTHPCDSGDCVFDEDGGFQLWGFCRE